MKPRQFIVAVGFVMAWFVSQQSLAEFKWFQASPIGLATETPTLVTFTAEIPSNPKLLKQSVNLLRKTPQGLKVIGAMRDDGLSGDLLANDNRYSLELSMNEQTPGQIEFQASAAYKGVLKRDISPPFALTIYPAADQILQLSPLSHNPAALTFAVNGRQDVTFLSQATGTQNPPAALMLWELDAKGQRLSPALGQLQPDTQNGDPATAGFTYSGRFSISTAIEGEKRYQATTSYQGMTVASPVSALSITRHPIGPLPIEVEDAIQDPDTGRHVAPDELLVKFQAGLSPAQIDTLLQPLNARVVGSLAENGILEVKFANAGDASALKKAQAQLQALPQVAFAEPNGVVYLGADSPDKSCISRSDNNCDWAAITVRANETWPILDTQITVAVIDSGVNSDADLPVNQTLLPGYNAEGGTGTADDNGHGSAVARLIAGRRNASGITGIGPGAHVLPIKAFKSGAAYYSHVADGINYAWQPPGLQQSKAVAKVINLSAWDAGQQIPSADTSTIKTAVSDATAHNTLVVSIAGNKNTDACQPGRLAKAIYDGGGLIVGGTTRADAKWKDSGFGQCVEIAAPSENVCTGLQPNDLSRCLTTAVDGRSLTTGTSFAAPQVSAAAALLFSQKPNRTLADVKQRLKLFSKPLDKQFCGAGQSAPCAGRLDVFSAVVSGALLSGKAWSTPVAQAFDVPGTRATYLYSLNNKGALVGSYVSNSGAPHGFVYDGVQFSTLDYPGAHLTEITGINDNDQKVGHYAPSPNAGHRGFLYAGGQFTPINPPGAASTIVTGINNAGHIVGYYADLSTGMAHGFLYDGSGFSTLDYPNASGGTVISGINNLSEVVGNYALNAQDPTMQHGFLRSGGTFRPIDVPNATWTTVSGINDLGQIVGSHAYAIGKDFGFIRNIDGTYTPTEGPNALYTYLRGINNSGRFVGDYFSGADFIQHGLLEQPSNATDDAFQGQVQPDNVKAGTLAKFMWNPADPIQTIFQIRLMINADPSLLADLTVEADVSADDYFELWANDVFEGNYLLDEHQQTTPPNPGIPRHFDLLNLRQDENTFEIRANDGGCQLEGGRCPDKPDAGLPSPRLYKAVFFDGIIKCRDQASTRCLLQGH